MLQKKLKERDAVEVDLRSQLSDLHTQLSDQQLKMSVYREKMNYFYTEMDLMNESQSLKDKELGDYIENVSRRVGVV